MFSTNNIFSILCFFEKHIFGTKIMFSGKSNDSHQLIFLLNSGNSQITLLKNRLSSFFLSLIDLVGIDLASINNYNLFFNLDDLYIGYNKTQIAYVYNTINYSHNCRYIFYCFNFKKQNLFTVNSVFLNANWLERELVEFFNVFITNRSDSRNLLLDYNFKGNPLLKNYPTEGYKELFFNYLGYNLEYTPAEFIEL